MKGKLTAALESNRYRQVSSERPHRDPSLTMPRVGNLRPEQIRLSDGDSAARTHFDIAARPAASSSGAGVDTVGTGDRADGGNPALNARQGRANPPKTAIQLLNEKTAETMLVFIYNCTWATNPHRSY